MFITRLRCCTETLFCFSAAHFSLAGSSAPTISRDMNIGEVRGLCTVPTKQAGLFGSQEQRHGEVTAAPIDFVPSGVRCSRPFRP